MYQNFLAMEAARAQLKAALLTVLVLQNASGVDAETGSYFNGITAHATQDADGEVQAEVSLFCGPNEVMGWSL
jgi:hypothetical protein